MLLSVPARPSQARSAPLKCCPCLRVPGVCGKVSSRWRAGCRGEGPGPAARLCWAGCLTENEYLIKEYDYLKHPYPQFIQESLAANERVIPSSESNAQPASGRMTPEIQRPATSHTFLSRSNSDDEEGFVTPVKKNKRSSSDVTGLSPMRFTSSPLYRDPTLNF